MVTREDALNDLALYIHEVWETKIRHLTPREAAERAWHPAHPLSIDELTVEIEKTGLAQGQARS